MKTKNDKDYGWFATVEFASDLAYNVFRKSEYNYQMRDYFSRNDITCPEDLFKKIRYAFLKGISGNDGIRITKKDIGEYHFRKNEFSLIHLIKALEWFEGFASKATSINGSSFYKAMNDFKYHCCRKFAINSDEYKSDYDNF